jgi:hypothetical protein
MYLNKRGHSLNKDAFAYITIEAVFFKKENIENT